MRDNRSIWHSKNSNIAGEKIVNYCYLRDLKFIRELPKANSEESNPPRRLLEKDLIPLRRIDETKYHGDSKVNNANYVKKIREKRSDQLITEYIEERELNFWGKLEKITLEKKKTVKC